MENFIQSRSKQAQIVFSRKINKATHPQLFLYNSKVTLSSYQKHLGLTLDSKLSFNERINDKICKAKECAVLLRELQPVLPRASLLTIYKSFIRCFLGFMHM